MANTDRFFADLPSFNSFSLCAEQGFYHPLPEHWHIVVTDVVASTKAIEAGQQKQVNAVAAASVVAIRNIVNHLNVPFTFGGDGATICLPSEHLNAITPALCATRAMAAERFNLTLRIGAVPISSLREAGHDVLLAKFEPYPHYHQAMFGGSGVSIAESWIKSDDQRFQINGQAAHNSELFEGFECRWNEVPAPQGENLTIIVQALDEEPHATRRLYRSVLQDIEQIYGPEQSHRPIREDDLSLTADFALLSVESGIRTAFMPKWRWTLYAVKLRLLRLIGICLMRFGVQTQESNWRDYKRTFIQNSDFRKFDGTLRMIVSGTAQQRKQMLEKLENHQKDGAIVYGTHIAPAALVTCIIQDYNKAHLHLIDTSLGGYAMAAKQMKQQLGAKAPS